MVSLVALVSFSFHYVIAQSLAIVSTIFAGIFVTIDNDEPFTQSIIISTRGALCLDNDKVNYQLLATSRFSFIGFWLVMLPGNTTNNRQITTIQSSPKRLFIFKDSVSKQDFSRLARVIKQLGETTKLPNTFS